jgi:hypothetical protein
VFVLNEVPDQEFVSGYYSTLHFLTVTSGQSIGTLNVEAVYDDASSDIVQVGLYDWFNQDGDAQSIPVGHQGKRRDQVNSIGFARADREGISLDAGGGNFDGAWLFAHSVAVDACKTLTQVKLSISPDADGRIHVIAATFDDGICQACSTPVFDVFGAPPADTEPDGAVDQKDFAAFQRCLNTVPGEYTEPYCQCLDVTGDEMVNGDDFTYFLACLTGPAPANPPPAGCDEP